MPKGIDNHEAWQKAKAQAEEAGKRGNWPYVMGIYKKMTGSSQPEYTKAWDEPENKRAVEEAVKKNKVPGITLKDLEEKPNVYYPVAMTHISKSFIKAEHLDDAQRRKIAKQYSSNPGKWSVRSLAASSGHSKKQVEKVVAGLGKGVKTEKHIQKKQSDHARWRGKKLPKHIVEANHRGRNKEIATRETTSMEKPIQRWLKEFGISYNSQVDVGRLVGSNDPELGIVDFVIPSKKMVIQADGPRHRLQNVKSRIGKQDSLLRSKGYKVVHISDTEMSQGKAKGILKGAVAGKEKAPEE